jgi:hypothetical protein
LVAVGLAVVEGSGLPVSTATVAPMVAREPLRLGPELEARAGAVAALVGGWSAAVRVLVGAAVGAPEGR